MQKSLEEAARKPKPTKRPQRAAPPKRQNSAGVHTMAHCETCSAPLNDSIAVNAHCAKCRPLSPPPRFKCPFCAARFNTRGYLRSHTMQWCSARKHPAASSASLAGIKDEPAATGDDEEPVDAKFEALFAYDGNQPLPPIDDAYALSDGTDDDGDVDVTGDDLDVDVTADVLDVDVNIDTGGDASGFPCTWCSFHVSLHKVYIVRVQL